MSGFLMDIFNDISLSKDTDMWESDEDSRDKNRERIQFLAGYEESSFAEVLALTKSPGRKNEAISLALWKKAEASNGTSKQVETANLHLNQALCYAETEPTRNTIHRFRAKRLMEDDKTEEALEDLLEITNPGEEDRKNIKILKKQQRKKEKKLGGQEKVSNSGLDKDSVSSNEEIICDEARHSRYRQFTNAIDVREEKGQGRFLIANRTILPGEVIGQEYSFAGILDRKFSRSHCAHCLLPTTRIFPCLSCSTVVFCSKSCRDKALTSFHKFECLLLDQIYRADTEAWLLAYRTVTSLPESYWISVDISKQKIESEYKSEDISTVYGLVTHDNEADRCGPVLMKECWTALFFTRCLQISNYFGQGSEKPQCGMLSDTELCVAMHILHIMRVAFFNSHEVTEIVKSGTRWYKHQVRRIGMCINPSLALINHSCDPNYARVVKGRSALAFATRTINKGEEILDVYGPTFIKSSRIDRHEVTDRYNFYCNCKPCQENWPTEATMERTISKKNCLPPANEEKLKLVKELEQTLEKFLSESWLDSMDAASAAKEISSSLSAAKQLIKEPHWLPLQSETMLHKALWDVHG